MRTSTLSLALLAVILLFPLDGYAQAKGAANAGGLPACKTELASCNLDFQVCLEELTACEAPKPVSALTGGTVVSADGRAFISVPPGALERDTDIRIKLVERPVVDVKRASGVYDFTPDGQTFKAPATVCLGASFAPDESVCLGYYDEDNRSWKCQDECLEQVSPSFWCGKTDHFTNFAILLRGSSSKENRCGADKD